jgi:hypothetical protein
MWCAMLTPCGCRSTSKAALNCVPTPHTSKNFPLVVTKPASRPYTRGCVGGAPRIHDAVFDDSRGTTHSRCAGPDRQSEYLYAAEPTFDTPGSSIIIGGFQQTHRLPHKALQPFHLLFRRSALWLRAPRTRQARAGAHLRSNSCEWRARLETLRPQPVCPVPQIQVH